MKYHALYVIFEKDANFEFVVCCKLYVALYGLNKCTVHIKSLKWLANIANMILFFATRCDIYCNPLEMTTPITGTCFLRAETN